MRRIALLLILVVSAVASAAAQDRIVLQTDPEEIESILGILDELEPIRTLVLEEGGRFTSDDIKNLIALADRAEVLGIEDLAAELRMLAVLAEQSLAGPRETVAEESLLSPGVTPVFDVRNFQRLTNITASLGVASFALSALFHYLAEQTYERYMNPLYTSPEFFQQFRTYDLLSVSMGAASLVTLGVGVPLTFAAPNIWSVDTSVPPAQATYTAEERQKQLEQLLVRRARVSEAIKLLPDREPLRESITTWSLVAGAAGFVGSVTSFYLADSLYGQYLDAVTTEDAETLGSLVSLFDVIGVLSGIVAGAGFGTAAGVEIVTSNRAELESRLKNINDEIVTVRLARPLSESVVEPIDSEPAVDNATAAEAAPERGNGG